MIRRFLPLLASLPLAISCGRQVGVRRAPAPLAPRASGPPLALSPCPEEEAPEPASPEAHVVEVPVRPGLGNTGTITGTVKDDANGSALAGVTVVATSPALSGTAAELSDQAGLYTITNLPPGTYEVTYYYSDLTIRRPNITVAVGRATPVHVRLNTGLAGGQLITIEEKAPSIDVSSTKQGGTVDQDYMRNIPLPRRTFQGALAGAAGAQGDGLGVAWAEPSPAADELWIIARAPDADGRSARRSDCYGSGQLHTRRGEEDVLLPLERTDVRAKIVGSIASVDVAQVYRNPYEEAIEAVYVFPLPEDAAVADFVMTIGTRRIRGVVREREEAESLYREARASGYVASLLTEERPNIFTQRVANLQARARIDVRLTYHDALPYRDGEYVFSFPMVVGPRYKPAAEVVYLRPDQKIDHRLSLSVELDAGVPIVALESEQHTIRVEDLGPRRRRIVLGETVPNQDFVLRYKLAGRTTQPSFFVHRAAGGGEGWFLFTLQPPASADDVPRAPLEMVFVLDCSGSMSGVPLAKAKRALRRALERLDARDTFQIIRFSDRASALGPAPIAATRQNVKRGLAYLDTLDAEGGTEMLSGIRAALGFPHAPERLRVVSFMTDGYIGNEPEILAAIHKQLGASRVFSFGVGSAVNRYLLEAMAVEGRGAVAYVGLDDDTGAREVDAFYQRLGHPALADVAVSFEGMSVSDVYPSRIPDLFVGRPVVLAGRLHGPLGKRIVVHGRQGGRAVKLEIPIEPAQVVSHPALAKIWARKKIADLIAEGTRSGEDMSRSIRSVALTHGLLSAFTAFVAVDASRRTASSGGHRVAVPVTVPAGVRYETTVSEPTR